MPRAPRHFLLRIPSLSENGAFRGLVNTPPTAICWTLFNQALCRLHVPEGRAATVYGAAGTQLQRGSMQRAHVQVSRYVYRSTQQQNILHTGQVTAAWVVVPVRIS